MNSTRRPGPDISPKDSGRNSRAEFTRQAILFGPELRRLALAEELSLRGFRRLALVTSPSSAPLAEGEAFEAIRDVVDFPIVHHSVMPHAPIAETERLASQASEVPIDGILTIGGGSAIDTSKALAILLSEGGSLPDHCIRFAPPRGISVPELAAPKLPIIAIPTTLSGAEQTAGGGATDEHGVKKTFWDRKLTASLIAYDYSAFDVVPRDVLVETAMNAVAHCAEGMYSVTANPVSHAFALAGASTLGEGLRLLAHSGVVGPDVLRLLVEGGALAGCVIANARSALHHAICHVVGSRGGLSHGAANSIILPHALAFNAPYTVREQQDFALAFSGGRTQDASEAVTALRSAVGAPSRLRDFKLSADDLEEFAEATMYDKSLYFNPKPVEHPREVLGILRNAW